MSAHMIFLSFAITKTCGGAASSELMEVKNNIFAQKATRR